MVQMGGSNPTGTRLYQIKAESSESVHAGMGQILLMIAGVQF